MLKKILVAELIEDGSVLLQALKRNRFPITAAAWYDFPEAEWRLVIATSAVDQHGPMAAYGRVLRALETFQPKALTLSDVTVVSPLSHEFQKLRALMPAAGGPARSVVFDDAYVYQL
jgi:hypothetical protein